MTSTSPVPTPDRVGQGTAVEQSRAAAEVLGAIEAAQRWPRDVQEAIRELTITCGMMSVAEKAFYSYPQAGTTVEGSTVSLAECMALAWGHIHFGINELRRDEEYGQSEILCWAWDLQKSVRNSRTFILPHRAYAPKKGSKVTRMVDLREIQFNNLSVGGRNVRESMFKVMPAWFRERAERECRKTLTDGELVDGERVALPPLPERIEAVIDWYAGKLDVSERQLARKRGCPASQWTVHDVVALGNLGRSITAGEIQKAAAFPPDTVSGAAIIAAAPPPESTRDTAHGVSPADTEITTEASPSTRDDHARTVGSES